MKVAVLGVGSVLMGDDGVGPWVVARLRGRYLFSSEVTVEDLGTPGPELLYAIDGVDALVLIDAVRASGEPGELRFYRTEEILRPGPEGRISPHDPGLRQTLLTADLTGQAPGQVLLVGIIPGVVELGTELSPRVRDALPEVERAVVAELTRLGVPPVLRAEPRSERPWWRPEGATPASPQEPAR